MHKRRYFTSMKLGPNLRPPVCLRYAIWALAASVSDKYVHLEDVFYQRARRYAEAEEMKVGNFSKIGRVTELRDFRVMAKRLLPSIMRKPGIC